MTETHVHTLLGGYTLGILDADEIRAVDEHIESCAECRDELAAVTEATALLALLPADEARSLVASEPGPQDALPAEDDLVLRRTLRAVRAERSGQQMRRLTLVAAGVAVLVGIGAATGFLAGNQSSEVSGAQPTLTATPAPSTQGAVPPSLPPGAKILTAS
ncbi:MAG TPA: zf-HC2 domain-containing protein, partial [Kribbellaceae bacterium]